MPTLIVETRINAPIEICFDAARDIGLHCETASRTGERAVAGVMTGLINLGETVTFEAVHFGIRQRLTAKIVEFERPQRFVDETTQSAFKSLRHIHEFVSTEQGQGTLMRDTLIWVSPFGIFGVVADKVALERHLRKFLVERNERLKLVIENGAYGSGTSNP
jgi:ligand-binding SRPBCC domain-containing protein